MQDSHPNHSLVEMLRAIIVGASTNPRALKRLKRWTEYHSLLPQTDLDVELKLGPDASPAMVREHVAAVFGDKLASLSFLRPTNYDHNLKVIASAFDLDAVDAALLNFAIISTENEELQELIRTLLDAIDCWQLVAFAVNGSREEVRRRCLVQGKLYSTGLINHGDQRLNGQILVAAPSIVSIVEGSLVSPEEVRGKLIGEEAVSDLEWDDYDHIKKERDLLLRVLQGALKERVPGINVLVYGPPGTGKTEFCKVVAKRLNMPLYSVGEHDEHNDEPNRFDRTQAYRMAERLLSSTCAGIVLFDEMEDAFIGSPSSQVSRVYSHRMLEGNRVPVLWTSNHPERLEPALLRRMTMAVELKVPPATTRTLILERVVAKLGTPLSRSEIVKFGTDLEAAPAIIATGVRCMRLANGDSSDMEQVVRGISRVVSGQRIVGGVKAPTLSDFDVSLINCDTNLPHFSNCIKRTGKRRLSLCLFGPPGTGKSAFARHIANVLQLEVLEKRASDLFSAWVGETEKKIAAAFAEASDRDALLIFDEADSLLCDRAQAMRSWEISQVNEMLTWIESHPLPVVCTTNMMERLDEASLRRFTFRLNFTFLTKKQLETAFTHFFDLPPPPGLVHLATLTPGDFAVVKDKAEILGGLDDSALLLAMLRDECRAKSYVKPQQVGFVHARGRNSST